MTDEEQAVWGRTSSCSQRRLDDGSLILAGPTLGQINTGIHVFEAPDEETAERMMNEDPAISSGIARASCAASARRSCAGSLRRSEVEHAASGPTSEPSVCAAAPPVDLADVSPSAITSPCRAGRRRGLEHRRRSPRLVLARSNTALDVGQPEDVQAERVRSAPVVVERGKGARWRTRATSSRSRLGLDAAGVLFGHHATAGWVSSIIARSVGEERLGRARRAGARGRASRRPSGCSGSGPAHRRPRGQAHVCTESAHRRQLHGAVGKQRGRDRETSPPAYV